LVGPPGCDTARFFSQKKHYFFTLHRNGIVHAKKIQRSSAAKQRRLIFINENNDFVIRGDETFDYLFIINEALGST
jgi:hypothetical protein